MGNQVVTSEKRIISPAFCPKSNNFLSLEVREIT